MENIKEFIKKNRVVITLVVFSILLVLSNIFFVRFAFDAIVIALVVIAIILKKQKEFFKDWTIPILLFYLYEFLRGKGYVIAQYLNRPLVNEWLIDLESKLFSFNGEISVVFLQYTLSNPSAKTFIPLWYDYILFLFYTSFFWFWLVIGFIIWNKSRKMFKQYMYGLVGFSLFDTLIYIFYPSVPPWYASQMEVLPFLRRVMWSYDFLPSKYTSLVSTYGNNEFAAFPSHHAAWPFFGALFIVRLFGKKAWPIFIVPLVIAFATWYGAEHYIIDSIFGFVIAYVTYLLVTGDLVRFCKKVFKR